METGAENYLTALTGEALGLFSDNLPYVDQTVREILAGGEEIEARLEEAGNPLESESYSPDLYESVYAVLNDAPVSYTHLDVYKRQLMTSVTIGMPVFLLAACSSSIPSARRPWKA